MAIFKKYFPWFLIVLLIGGLALVSADKNNLDTQLDTLSTQITLLKTEQNNLENNNKALVDQISEMIIENSKSNTVEVPDYVQGRLSENGFPSPEALLDTLTFENALIPHDGILGGSMQWWPSESRILTENWVLGYFEDGHIMGHGILSYTLLGEGNVEWELITSKIAE